MVLHFQVKANLRLLHEYEWHYAKEATAAAQRAANISARVKTGILKELLDDTEEDFLDSMEPSTSAAAQDRRRISFRRHTTTFEYSAQTSQISLPTVESDKGVTPRKSRFASPWMSARAGVERKLLKWVNDEISDNYHIDIRNFDSDWCDGIAFCALVHRFFPALINMRRVRELNTPAENLQLAFERARIHLNIKPLLNINEMTRKDRVPDKCSVIMYLSQFLAFISPPSAPAPDIAVQIVGTHDKSTGLLDFLPSEFNATRPYLCWLKETMEDETLNKVAVNPTANGSLAIEEYMRYIRKRTEFYEYFLAYKEIIEYIPAVGDAKNQRTLIEIEAKWKHVSDILYVWNQRLASEYDTISALFGAVVRWVDEGEHLIRTTAPSMTRFDTRHIDASMERIETTLYNFDSFFRAYPERRDAFYEAYNKFDNEKRPENDALLSLLRQRFDELSALYHVETSRLLLLQAYYRLLAFLAELKSRTRLWSNATSRALTRRWLDEYMKAEAEHPEIRLENLLLQLSNAVPEEQGSLRIQGEAMYLELEKEAKMSIRQTLSLGSRLQCWLTLWENFDAIEARLCSTSGDYCNTIVDNCGEIARQIATEDAPAAVRQAVDARMRRLREIVKAHSISKIGQNSIVKRHKISNESDDVGDELPAWLANVERLLRRRATDADSAAEILKKIEHYQQYLPASQELPSVNDCSRRLSHRAEKLYQLMPALLDVERTLETMEEWIFYHAPECEIANLSIKERADRLNAVGDTLRQLRDKNFVDAVDVGRLEAVFLHIRSRISFVEIHEIEICVEVIQTKALVIRSRRRMHPPPIGKPSGDLTSANILKEELYLYEQAERDSAEIDGDIAGVLQTLNEVSIATGPALTAALGSSSDFVDQVAAEAVLRIASLKRKIEMHQRRASLEHDASQPSSSSSGSPPWRGRLDDLLQRKADVLQRSEASEQMARSSIVEMSMLNEAIQTQFREATNNKSDVAAAKVASFQRLESEWLRKKAALDRLLHIFTETRRLERQAQKCEAPNQLATCRAETNALQRVVDTALGVDLPLLTLVRERLQSARDRLAQLTAVQERRRRREAIALRLYALKMSGQEDLGIAEEIVKEIVDEIDATLRASEVSTNLTLVDNSAEAEFDEWRDIRVLSDRVCGTIAHKMEFFERIEAFRDRIAALQRLADSCATIRSDEMEMVVNTLDDTIADTCSALANERIQLEAAVCTLQSEFYDVERDRIRENLEKLCQKQKTVAVLFENRRAFLSHLADYRRVVAECQNAIAATSAANCADGSDVEKMATDLNALKSQLHTVAERLIRAQRLAQMNVVDLKIEETIRQIYELVVPGTDLLGLLERAARVSESLRQSLETPLPNIEPNILIAEYAGQLKEKTFTEKAQLSQMEELKRQYDITASAHAARSKSAEALTRYENVTTALATLRESAARRDDECVQLIYRAVQIAVQRLADALTAFDTEPAVSLDKNTTLVALTHDIDALERDSAAACAVSGVRLPAEYSAQWIRQFDELRTASAAVAARLAQAQADAARDARREQKLLKHLGSFGKWLNLMDTEIDATLAAIDLSDAQKQRRLADLRDNSLYHAKLVIRLEEFKFSNNNQIAEVNICCQRYRTLMARFGDWRLPEMHDIVVRVARSEPASQMASATTATPIIVPWPAPDSRSVSTYTVDSEWSQTSLSSLSGAQTDNMDKLDDGFGGLELEANRAASIRAATCPSTDPDDYLRLIFTEAQLALDKGDPAPISAIETAIFDILTDVQQLQRDYHPCVPLRALTLSRNDLRRLRVSVRQMSTARAELRRLAARNDDARLKRLARRLRHERSTIKLFYRTLENEIDDETALCVNYQQIVGGLVELESQVHASRPNEACAAIDRISLALELLKKQTRRQRRYVAFGIDASDKSLSTRAKIIYRITNSVTTVINVIELGLNNQNEGRSQIQAPAEFSTLRHQLVGLSERARVELPLESFDDELLTSTGPKIEAAPEEMSTPLSDATRAKTQPPPKAVKSIEHIIELSTSAVETFESLKNAAMDLLVDVEKHADVIAVVRQKCEEKRIELEKTLREPKTDDKMNEDVATANLIQSYTLLEDSLFKKEETQRADALSHRLDEQIRAGERTLRDSTADVDQMANTLKDIEVTITDIDLSTEAGMVAEESLKLVKLRLIANSLRAEFERADEARRLIEESAQILARVSAAVSTTTKAPPQPANVVRARMDELESNKCELQELRARGVQLARLFVDLPIRQQIDDELHEYENLLIDLKAELIADSDRTARFAALDVQITDAAAELTRGGTLPSELVVALRRNVREISEEPPLRYLQHDDRSSLDLVYSKLTKLESTLEQQQRLPKKRQELEQQTDKHLQEQQKLQNLEKQQELQQQSRKQEEVIEQQLTEKHRLEEDQKSYHLEKLQQIEQQYLPEAQQFDSQQSNQKELTQQSGQGKKQLYLDRQQQSQMEEELSREHAEREKPETETEKTKETPHEKKLSKKDKKKTKKAKRKADEDEKLKKAKEQDESAMQKDEEEEKAKKAKKEANEAEAELMNSVERQFDASTETLDLLSNPDAILLPDHYEKVCQQIVDQTEKIQGQLAITESSEIIAGHLAAGETFVRQLTDRRAHWLAFIELKQKINGRLDALRGSLDQLEPINGGLKNDEDVSQQLDEFNCQHSTALEQLSKSLDKLRYLSDSLAPLKSPAADVRFLEADYSQCVERLEELTTIINDELVDERTSFQMATDLAAEIESIRQNIFETDQIDANKLCRTMAKLKERSKVARQRYEEATAIRRFVRPAEPSANGLTELDAKLKERIADIRRLECKVEMEKKINKLWLKLADVGENPTKGTIQLLRVDLASIEDISDGESNDIQDIQELRKKIEDLANREAHREKLKSQVDDLLESLSQKISESRQLIQIPKEKAQKKEKKNSSIIEKVSFSDLEAKFELLKRNVDELKTDELPRLRTARDDLTNAKYDTAPHNQRITELETGLDEIKNILAEVKTEIEFERSLRIEAGAILNEVDGTSQAVADDSVAAYDEMADKITTIQQRCDEWNESFKISTKYLKRDKVLDTTDVQKQLKHLTLKLNARKTVAEKRQKLVELRPRLEADIIALKSELDELTKTPPSLLAEQEATVKDLEVEKTKLKSLFDDIPDLDEAADLRSIPNIELDRLSELIDKLKKSIDKKSAALNSFLKLKSDLEAQLENIGNAIERADSADLNAVIDQQKQVEAIRARLAEDVYVDVLDDDHQNELELLRDATNRLDNNLKEFENNAKRLIAEKQQKYENLRKINAKNDTLITAVHDAQAVLNNAEAAPTAFDQTFENLKAITSDIQQHLSKDSQMAMYQLPEVAKNLSVAEKLIGDLKRRRDDWLEFVRLKIAINRSLDTACDELECIQSASMRTVDVVRDDLTKIVETQQFLNLLFVNLDEMRSMGDRLYPLEAVQADVRFLEADHEQIARKLEQLATNLNDEIQDETELAKQNKELEDELNRLSQIIERPDINLIELRKIEEDELGRLQKSYDNVESESLKDRKYVKPSKSHEKLRESLTDIKMSIKSRIQEMEQRRSDKFKTKYLEVAANPSLKGIEKLQKELESIPEDYFSLNDIRLDLIQLADKELQKSEHLKKINEVLNEAAQTLSKTEYVPSVTETSKSKKTKAKKGKIKIQKTEIEKPIATTSIDKATWLRKRIEKLETNISAIEQIRKESLVLNLDVKLCDQQLDKLRTTVDALKADLNVVESDMKAAEESMALIEDIERRMSKECLAAESTKNIDEMRHKLAEIQNSSKSINSMIGQLTEIDRTKLDDSQIVRLDQCKKSADDKVVKSRADFERLNQLIDRAEALQKYANEIGYCCLEIDTLLRRDKSLRDVVAAAVSIGEAETLAQRLNEIGTNINKIKKNNIETDNATVDEQKFEIEEQLGRLQNFAEELRKALDELAIQRSRKDELAKKIDQLAEEANRIKFINGDNDKLNIVEILEKEKEIVRIKLDELINEKENKGTMVIEDDLQLPSLDEKLTRLSNRISVEKLNAERMFQLCTTFDTVQQIIDTVTLAAEQNPEADEIAFKKALSDLTEIDQHLESIQKSADSFNVDDTSENSIKINVMSRLSQTVEELNNLRQAVGDRLESLQDFNESAKTIYSELKILEDFDAEKATADETGARCGASRAISEQIAKLRSCLKKLTPLSMPQATVVDLEQQLNKIVAFWEAAAASAAEKEQKEENKRQIEQLIGKINKKMKALKKKIIDSSELNSQQIDTIINRSIGPLNQEVEGIAKNKNFKLENDRLQLQSDLQSIESQLRKRLDEIQSRNQLETEIRLQIDECEVELADLERFHSNAVRPPTDAKSMVERLYAIRQTIANRSLEELQNDRARESLEEQCRALDHRIDKLMASLESEMQLEAQFRNCSNNLNRISELKSNYITINANKDSSETEAELAQHLAKVEELMKEEGEICEIESHPFKYILHDKTADTASIQIVQLAKDAEMLKAAFVQHQKLAELWPQVEAHRVVLNIQLTNLENQLPTTQQAQEITVNELETERDTLKSLLDGITDSDEASELKKEFELELNRLSELINKLNKAIGEKSMALNSFLTLKSDVEAQLKDIGQTIERTDPADLNAVIDQQKQLVAIQERFSNDVYVNELDEDHKIELENLFKLLETFNGKIERRQKLAELRPQVEAETLALRNKLDRLWTHPTTVLKNQQATLEDLVADDQRLRPILNDLACFDPAENLKKELQIELNRLVQDIKRYSNIVNEKSVYLSAWPSLKSELQDKIEEVWIAVGQSDPIYRNAIIDHENAIKAIKDQMFDNIKTYLMDSKEIEELDSINDNLKDLTEKLTFRRNLSEIFDDGEQPNRGVLNKVPTTSSADEMAVTDLKKKRTKLKSLLVSIPKLKTRKACELELEQLTELINELGKTSNASNDFLTLESEIDSRLKNVGKAIERANLSYMTVAIKRGKKMIAARGRLTCTHKLEDDLKAKLETIDNDSGNQTYQHEEAKKIGKIDQPESQNRELVEMLEGAQQLLIDPKAIPSRYEEMAHQLENQTVFKFRRILDDSSDCIKKIPEEIIENLQLAAEIKAELLRRHTDWLAFAERRATANRQLDMARDYLSNSTAGELRDLDTAKIELAVLEDTQKSLFDMADGLKELRSLGDRLEPLEAPHVDIRFLETDLEQTDKFIITVVCDLRNEIETESRLLDECQQIELELNKLGERADEQFKLDFLQKAQRELYPIRDRLEQLGVRQTTSKNSRKYIRYKSDRIQTLKAKFDKTDAKIRQKIQNSEEQIIEELSTKYAKLAENPSVEDVKQLESELKAMHTKSDKIEKLRKSIQELANDQTAKQNVKARASEAISRLQEQGLSISKLGQQEKKIGKKKKQKEIMKEQDSAERTELEELVDPDEKLTKLRKNFQKLESEIIPSVEKSHDEIVTARLDDKTHNQRVEEIQTISDRLKIEICDVIRSVEEIDKITSKLQRLKRSRDELGTQSAADFTPEEYMQYFIQKRDKINEMTSELRNINKPVTLATNLPLAAAIDAAVRRADEAVRFLDAKFIDAGIRIKIDNKMVELQKTIDVSAKKYRSQQIPCSVAAATEDLTRLEAKNEELSELADEINDKAKESKDYTTKEVFLSKSKEVQDQKTQLEYLLFMLRHNLNDVQELEAENSQICDEIDRLSTIRLDDSIPENQLEKLTGLQKELNIIHEKLNVFASRIENRDKFSPLVEYNPQVQYLHKLLSELKNSNNSEKKIVAEAILQKQIEYEFDKFSKIIDEADLVDSNPNVTAENIEVALHNLEQIEGIFEEIQHLSDSQSSAEDPSCRQSALNRLAEFGEEFANLRRSLEDRQSALRRFDESANATERQIYKLQFVELLTSKENQYSDQAYDQEHKHLLQDIEDQRNIGDQIGEQITKMRIDLNENLGSALPNHVEERLAELERCQKTAVEKINQIYDSVIREQEAERHQKFEMKFAEKLSVIDYKMNVTEKNLEEEIPSLASVVRIQNEELEPIRINIDGIREEKPPTEELSKRKNSVLYRFGVLEASLKQHLRELDEQERISSRLENEISSYEAKLETVDRYHRDDLRSPDEAENTIEQLKEKIDRETAQDLTLTSQMVDRKSPVSDMTSDVTENKSKTKATPKVPISEESKMLETSSDRNEHCVETRKIDKKFSKKQKGRKIGTNTFTEPQPELTVNFDPEQKKIQTKEGETTPIVADTTKTQFGESQKSRKECEDNRLDEQSNQPGRLKAGDDQLNISEAEVSSERTEKPSYDVEEAEKVFAAIFRDQDPTDMLRQQGFDDEDLLDLESSDDDAPDHGELTILSHKEGTGLSAAVESAAPAVNTVVQPAAGVNRWRRILRAALPLQAMLVLLLGAACLVPHCDDDYCCHLLNNFATTFESQLDFVNGPPPF